MLNFFIFFFPSFVSFFFCFVNNSQMPPIPTSTMGNVVFNNGELVTPTLPPMDNTIFTNIRNFTDTFLPPVSVSATNFTDSVIGCGTTESSTNTCCNIRTELRKAMALANCTHEARIVQELLNRNASILLNSIPAVFTKGLEFICNRGNTGSSSSSSNGNNSPNTNMMMNMINTVVVPSSTCYDVALKIVQTYQNRPVTQRGCADASLFIADLQFLCTKDTLTQEYCLPKLQELPTGLSDIRTRGWSHANDLTTSSQSIINLCDSSCIRSYQSTYTMVNAVQTAAIANTTDINNRMNTMDSSRKQEILTTAANRVGQLSAMLASINTNCRLDPTTNQLCAAQSTNAQSSGMNSPMDTVTSMLNNGTVMSGSSSGSMGMGRGLQMMNGGGGMSGVASGMSALRPQFLVSEIMCTYCGRSSLLGQAQVTLARLRSSGQHELRQVCEVSPPVMPNNVMSMNSNTNMPMLPDPKTYTNCTLVNATAEAIFIKQQVDNVIRAGACGKDTLGEFCVDHLKQFFPPVTSVPPQSVPASFPPSNNMNRLLRGLQMSIPSFDPTKLSNLGLDISSPLAKHVIEMMIGCGTYVNNYAKDNTATCPLLCGKALKSMVKDFGCCTSFLLNTTFQIMGSMLAPGLDGPAIGEAINGCDTIEFTPCSARTPRTVVTRVGGLNFHYVNSSSQRRDAFVKAYIRDIAAAVAEPESSFTITNLSPGSVIVSMSVSGSSDTAVSATVDTLSTVTSSPSFQLPSVSAIIAGDPVNALTDGSNLTLTNMVSLVTNSMSNSLVSGSNNPSNSAIVTVSYSFTLSFVLIVSLIMTWF